MRPLRALAWLVLAGAAMAQAGPSNAAGAVPQGEPEVSAALRDADFGVAARAPGLQRKVEMYQWRRSPRGYAAAWSREPVDSSRFDPAHANPGAFPVRERYWVANRVTLDGRPVHEDVLKEFGTWRSFRPGFSALPGNLAATFQPEGDGLSSSENPLDPQIGDLRITWHVLELPPLQGKVALEDGSWVPAQAVTPLVDPAVAADTGSPAVAARGEARSRMLWAWGAAGMLMVLGLVVLLRRRRVRAVR